MDTMKNCMPQAYDELVENCEILERHYKDMMVKFHSLFEAFDHSCHIILNLCDFRWFTHQVEFILHDLYLSSIFL